MYFLIAILVILVGLYLRYKPQLDIIDEGTQDDGIIVWYNYGDIGNGEYVRGYKYIIRYGIL